MDTIKPLLTALSTMLLIAGGVKLGTSLYTYFDRRANGAPGTGNEMWDMVAGGFLIALGAGAFLTNLFEKLNPIG